MYQSTTIGNPAVGDSFATDTFDMGLEVLYVYVYVYLDIYMFRYVCIYLYI